MTQVQRGNNRVRYTHWGRGTSIQTPLGDVTRPLAILRVHTQSGPVDIQGLVDSGADFVVFPQAIADGLGIPYSKAAQTQLNGISGTAPAYRCTTRLEILGLPTPNRPINCNVLIVNSNWPYPLIGRDPWFNLHHVGFNGLKGVYFFSSP
jgi:hypothetical protein